jgi:hypothetical protein
MSEWRPIETAPRDAKRPIIVMTRGGHPVRVVRVIVEGEAGPVWTWGTVEETDPCPACWTDGTCWASNADGEESDPPVWWCDAPPATDAKKDGSDA